MSCTFEVEALTPGFGVKLTGFDLESAIRDPSFLKDLKSLVDSRLLVYAPGQKLSPQAQQDLTASFGPLANIKWAGYDAHHVPGCEWIKVISNGLAPDGRPHGDGNSSAQIWHTDATWEVPVSHVAFYCRQTPEPAPKTGFKNMIAVYEALPDATKHRIARLRAIHHLYPKQIEVKVHAEGPTLPRERRELGFSHPLVRRHFGSDKAILYLPTRRDSVIPGLSDEEARALLEELWSFAESVDCSIRVPLRADDFVLWDNRACVHNREGWPEDQSRIMWHVAAFGESSTPMFPRQSLNVIGLSPEAASKVLMGEDPGY